MRTGLKKIVCGMSGGVDSSVAAYMLKKRGHEVVGLFMKNWDIADEKGKCSSDADREDAQYVCDRLKIPLHDVNFVKEYWNEVFSTLIKGYENGYTPNPDILCNKHIKFKYFFDHAINNIGADAIATGHYVKTSVFGNLENPDTSEGVKLMLPLDQWKDQTLFLSQIPQRALQKSVFPLGDILKNDVKKIAESIGLDRIAKKKESMGICFIGKRNFQSFVEEYIEQNPGNFVDVETGEIVGTHKGAHYWTIGQRTHLSGLDKAYFVSSLDTDSQTIYVDHKLLDCNGPQYLANAVADIFQKHRQDICILDVAAGTGLVGEELMKLGFCNIESLEPNKNMLAIAERKDVYRKHFEETIPETGNTKIGTDIYDVVVCRGGFGGGSLPVNALSEMLRMTKPGGYVAIATNPKHFDVVPMYVNTIVPLMKNLEEIGQWKKVKEEKLNNYVAGTTGILLVFQKTPQNI